MNKERIPLGILPWFDTIPELSEESIADVLHEQDDDEQLRLPIGSLIDDPFRGTTAMAC